jgi:hypothetical protein
MEKKMCLILRKEQGIFHTWWIGMSMSYFLGSGKKSRSPKGTLAQQEQGRTRSNYGLWLISQMFYVFEVLLDSGGKQYNS